MKRKSPLAIIAIAASVAILAADVIHLGDEQSNAIVGSLVSAAPLEPDTLAPVDDGRVSSHIEARQLDDLTAMETFRPGYPFWQNIFRIPDGSIAFGSARDGRLLAVFPTTGNWARDGSWTDPALATLLDGHDLPRSLDERRDYVAQLIEQVAGPVLHNPTRGLFLQPNVAPYGTFLTSGEPSTGDSACPPTSASHKPLSNPA